MHSLKFCFFIIKILNNYRNCHYIEWLTNNQHSYKAKSNKISINNNNLKKKCVIK